MKTINVIKLWFLLPVILACFSAACVSGGRAVPAITSDQATEEAADTKPVIESAPVQEQPQTTNTYKAGDTGPAGGVVFYDRGVYESGWRYLEAAPVDLGPVQWGTVDVLIKGTVEDIGGGRENTERILIFLKLRAETGRAAQIAFNYELGRYRDWFLPSKDELNMMYLNLKEKNLGGFPDGDIHYWSSTENSDRHAWLQLFSNGRTAGITKLARHYVRPIRAF